MIVALISCTNEQESTTIRQQIHDLNIHLDKMKDFLQKAAQLRESQLTALVSLKRILENVKRDEKNNWQEIYKK